MLKVIELFAGVGAQRQGLKEANIDHEVVAISEIDKYAIKVYEKLHGNTPNLGDITKIERLPKADLWTYSFPCTDISLSGKMLGFDKGSNTQSSLLWEVQRLLEIAKINNELPKYLLMENVKNIVSKRFKSNFEEWISFLEELGYKNFYQILNSKDFNIPQNRQRVFMLSIRDDKAEYSFPSPIPLSLKLKDMLEDEVDKKYYLSEKMLQFLNDETNRNGFIRKKQFRPHNIDESDIAFTITTKAGSRPTDNFIEVFDFRYDEGIRGRVDNDLSPTITTKAGSKGLSGQPFIKVPQATKQGYAIAEIGDGIYTNRTESKRGVVQKESVPTIKTSPNDLAVVVD
ncbi:DNA (cytosine-5-)-methyltransferase, partial [Acholeplasma equifetale]|uniref:DNA (cytosine-5-)-methyltransferase n=1 Tax=Acholeplasma equifetale TaxID=264634 RepID=UPI00138AB092